MASLHKVKQHGRNVYRVSFYDKDGTRRFIRLGEIGKKVAESIALHVQQLADMSCAGLPLDAEQVAWLAKIGQNLADKLQASPSGNNPRQLRSAASWTTTLRHSTSRTAPGAISSRPAIVSSSGLGPTATSKR
jgi:hypothetical protein